MENCANIFKQFGFKHVIERSWKAMRPQGRSPGPNHHLDQGHFHLLGTSELRWQLLFCLVSSAKSKHGVIAVKNSDGLDQWSIRRDNRHSEIPFTLPLTSRILLLAAIGCCGQMAGPFMFENVDSSFYSQISTLQEIHPLQAPETQNASKCDKIGNSCVSTVSLSSWCLSLPPGRTAWLWEKHLLKSIEIFVIPNSFH